MRRPEPLQPTTSLDHGRYLIRRRLGAGGMGVVYEAYDRQRDRLVALKTLRQVNPAALRRFKREFRSLADLSHPNLVSLYDLSTTGQYSFFTMELVDGVDVLRYLRPPHLGHSPSPQTEPGAAHPDRIRTALGQLVRGLMALHHAGKVHRDIKPSNVLVAKSGRVVIVDFGLTVEAMQDGRDADLDDAMWGTAAYMAPEHGRQAPEPAQDWYAVGIILYQALTGDTPHDGGPATILRNNWRTHAPAFPPPTRLAVDLPPDLVDLCRALLSRDPRHRPAGREILRCLGFTGRHVDSLASSIAGRSPYLVGRSAELAHLHYAFYLVCTGRCVTVFVHGQSGIGKTELVIRFLDQLNDAARVTVLRGRCHPRESVPHKALDGLVDSLCEALRSLREHEIREIVPDGIDHLVRLFPLMGTLPVPYSTPASDRRSDPLDVRRLALHSLRDILVRLARRAPLVLHIDDLQWASDEEIATLDSLFASSARVPVLLIVGFRSEDLATRPQLRQLAARTGEGIHQIKLAAMSAEDTRELIGRLDPDAPEQSTLDAIYRESAGNPLLIEQMVRFTRAGQRRAQVSAGLRDIIIARLDRLPRHAAAILETIAIAGHPVQSATVRHVMGLTQDPQGVLNALVAANLLRCERNDWYEIYHERIRDVLLTGIAPATTATVHGRLAEALEAAGHTSPDALFAHYFGAGRFRPAQRHAIRAAEHAAAALAFDRAADFYARAVALNEPGHQENEALHAALGRCLASTGRLVDASRAYSEAARLAPVSRAIDHRRLAAEYMLLSGRIEEGLEQVRSMLRHVGLRFPTSRASAIAALGWNRLLLGLRLRWHQVRGLRKGRSGDRVGDPLHIYRSVADGVTNVDYVRGAYFQTRHALMSLRRGQPEDVARALAIQSIFALLRGGDRAERRARALLRQAERLASRSHSATAAALCALMTGTMSYFLGEWARSRAATSRAAEQLRRHGVGGPWELLTARFYHTFSLFYLGEIRELCRVTDEYLRDAQERGNRFAATIGRTGPANVTWLVRDDAAGALAALREALADWPDTPFRVPHYLALAAETRALLYQGLPVAAWETVRRAWPALKRSDLLRIQTIRIIMLHLRGISAAAGSHAQPVLRQMAHRDARLLEREGRRWSDGLACVLRASIAAARGDVDEAVTEFRESVIIFDDADMTLHAAAARGALGRLLGGDEGLDLIAGADEWMARQGIVNPHRMAATIAPSED